MFRFRRAMTSCLFIGRRRSPLGQFTGYMLTFGVSIHWRIIAPTLSRTLAVDALLTRVHGRRWLGELRCVVVLGRSRAKATTGPERNWNQRVRNQQKFEKLAAYRRYAPSLVPVIWRVAGFHILGVMGSNVEDDGGQEQKRTSALCKPSTSVLGWNSAAVS